MSGQILLLAFSPEAEARLVEDLPLIREAEPAAHYVLLTGKALFQTPPDGIKTIWREADKRGAGAFLALMRRLSWQQFEAVYDLEASFLSGFMRFCLWPRPKWHVWPFLTCGNRASNL
ncbi:MAG: hypothetical protein GC184_10345 [Rhizobiales bacterium]|nr:hypothetical protein [Hyphomicrobiales bacterium]